MKLNDHQSIVQVPVFFAGFAPLREIVSRKGAKTPRKSLNLKMRIFDNAEHVPEGILDASHSDPFANILHCFMHGRAELDDSLECGVRVFDSPVSNGAVGSVRDVSVSRLQAKLVAGDIEPDIERLVEVWFCAEHFAVPGLAFFDVVNVIDCCSETEKHVPLLGACQKPDRQGGQPALANARACGHSTQPLQVL